MNRRRDWTILAALSLCALFAISFTAAPAQAKEPKAKGDAQPKAGLAPPFEKRIPAPSLSGGVDWLNTAGPIDLKDLRGKFVLLDFWTYCCINCIHVLPELKKLEQAYPNELVVIGVHSAKFDAEKDSQNIREAILRYEIQHPVVNDANHTLWRKYSVSSWPTMVLIDPEGYAVWMRGGENTFEFLDALLKHGLPYYREQGLVDAKPIKFDLESAKAAQTPLRFPGKVLADEAGGRLFITDSNHNRIVVAELNGKLLDVIGAGPIGRNDGGYAEATFDHPQGLALDGETLYVADTENHLLRKVDLKQKQVSTIAGTGVQARGPWPGMEQADYDAEGAPRLPTRFVGPPLKTPLSSPWALWVHDGALYIAMAGPHQIWKMPLAGEEIGPYAGNGREDIVDGRLLPPAPYQAGYSSFAQPSGLASDGKWLYVADSEGSSIRAVPFDSKEKVKTIIGTAHLPYARLFTFGDVDGKNKAVRLQHVLGVTYHAGKLYVADTYNHKVKVIDLKDKTCETIAGDGQPNLLNEPAGISYAAGKLYVADTNNHRIRVIDLEQDAKLTTLEIAGLAPPGVSAEVAASESAEAAFADATPITVPKQTLAARDGKITLQAALQLPVGWKMNPLAPQKYLVRVQGESGPIDRAAVGKLVDVKPPSDTFEVALPVSAAGEETVTLSLAYYYCTADGGECKQGAVTWTVPIQITPEGTTNAVQLTLPVE